MPDQKEQDEVRAYCCTRPLTRPDTSVKTAIIAMLVFMAIVAVVSIGTAYVLFWMGNHFALDWFGEHTATTWVLSRAGCLLIALSIVRKKIVIGMVRLYQHYAPDDLRRKCILKPTCSEYMILAVEKYGFFRGVKKGVYRLLFTCRGWDYRVDEP